MSVKIPFIFVVVSLKMWFLVCFFFWNCCSFLFHFSSIIVVDLCYISFLFCNYWFCSFFIYCRSFLFMFWFCFYRCFSYTFFHLLRLILAPFLYRMLFVLFFPIIVVFLRVCSCNACYCIFFYCSNYQQRQQLKKTVT